jgi:hypothetical protein
MIQLRSGTFHDREAPPPEATTAPLVRVTAMRRHIRRKDSRYPGVKLHRRVTQQMDDLC